MRMSGRTMRCDHCHRNFKGNLPIPASNKLQDIGDSLRSMLEKNWKVYINTSTHKMHCFCTRCDPSDSGVRWTQFFIEDGVVKTADRVMVPSAAGNMFSTANLSDDKYNPL